MICLEFMTKNVFEIKVSIIERRKFDKKSLNKIFKYKEFFLKFEITLKKILKVKVKQFSTKISK